MNEHDIEILKYRINKLLCWHPKSYRKIIKYDNGLVVYCSRCYLKVLSVHDSGSKGRTE